MLSQSSAATTQFDGYAVWAEIEDLQPVISYVAEKYNLFNHPSHMTLVYGLQKSDHSISEKFAKLEGELNSFQKVEIQTSVLTSGLSKLFGHGYCDLFFHRSAELDQLYQKCMDTMEWSYKSESFAGAPHACLGYSQPEVEAFATSAIEQDILAQFPDLCSRSFTISAVSLWSVEGTTTDWHRVSSFTLS